MISSSRRARLRWLALFTALALVLGACGDDDDGDGDAAAGEDGGGGGSEESKGTIVLGTIGTSVGNTGQPQLDETQKVAEVWQRLKNAAGGINGWEVEVAYRDGQNDTARVLQAVTELDQQGILAIAGLGASTRITASIPRLESAQIPVVGGIPYTPEWDTHPLFFQVSASYYAGVAGQVYAAKHVGSTHFRNIYCTEVPACAQSVPVTEAATRVLGMTHSQAGASARATEYTAVCLEARNAGVDFFQSNGLNTPNVIRDCASQNYHPTYGIGGEARRETAEILGQEKYAGNLYEFGAFYDGPEVRAFRQAMARTDMEDGEWGQTSVQVWLGLEMAAKAIEKLEGDNPTRADFLAALQSIKGEDLDGLIPPVDYTQQRNGGKFMQDCWTEHRLVDGELVHIDDEGEPVDRLTFLCGSKSADVRVVRAGR